MNMKNKIKELLKCNLWKTVYFNFKMLPFSQAKKLPIWFYGKTDFRSLKGNVELVGSTYSGMVSVGKQDVYVDTNVQNTIWTINGTLRLEGPIRFFRGSYVLVAKRGVLDIKSKPTELGITKIGSNIHIFCFDKITIGYCTRIAWDCQIYDSSFHYIEYLGKNEKPATLSKPVVIGDHAWIGNRTTISKGTVIPNYAIVASNSLVNKDFSEAGENILLAGLPAKVKASGLRRIFDRKIERELDKQYNYSRTGL